ncbi:MAG: flavodoxin [Dehalococcoidia bacterium]|nr:flavodoxin [Dehalococcoidia bacterium]
MFVLYDASGPQIVELAKAIAEGVAEAPGAEAVLRHVTEVKRQDLLDADALVLGSPNWSGITGRLKTWLDDQGDLWEEGALNGKVGAAFATGHGRHTGIEFTLLALIHWMLACGMVIVGLPWRDDMRTSGAYYGATAAGGPVTDNDRAHARAIGKRVAEFAARLK